MFMNYKFLDLPTNYNFSKTCQKIEQVLRSISSRLEDIEGQKEKDSDHLWLLFLTAMGTDIFSARGDTPYSSWPVMEFHRVCARLNVSGHEQVRAALHRYPHYGEMDGFQTELLLHKTPTTNIIPWSNWRTTFNIA
jgi:hypothetical protein